MHPSLDRFAAVRILLLVLALLPLATRAARAQVQIPSGFRDSVIVGGLDVPVGMAFLPDGRLLVVEKDSARLQMVRNGVLSLVFTVPEVQNSPFSEQGLLGIAVDPAWPSKPLLYFHVSDGPTATHRITRYTVGGDLTNTGTGALSIDPASRRDLVTGIPDAASNHNGGTLRFGLDGMLYASYGEDANRCAAQDTLSIRGVILRLDVSGVPAGGGAAPALATLIPADNPLADHVDARSRAIWAWGLRNPFRFHVDAADGALFIADVGQNAIEEIDWATAPGMNFGWPVFEGNIAGPGGCSLRGTASAPIWAVDRTNDPSAAIISAGVYRLPAGCARPDCGFPAEYEGDYFFSDYYTGSLQRLKRVGSTWSLAAPVAGQPATGNWGEGFIYVGDYLVGADGGLWYCSAGNGEVHAIYARSDTTVPVPPPSPAPGIAFAAPYPQPATGAVTFRYTLVRPARVSLRLYDLRGRLVRTLLDRAIRGPGVAPVQWEGTDDDGRRAPSGVYVARLDVDGTHLERRVVLAR